MRVRIVGTSAGWGRFVERTAIAFLLLGLIVAVTGIVTHLRQRASEQIPRIAHSNPPATAPALPPPALPPPAPTQPATPEASAAPAVALPVPAKQPAPHVASAAKSVEKEKAESTTKLRGMGAVVVLALAEETAVQLREHPDQLAELVRQGLLFTAPNQTAVEIEEVRNGLVKVRLTGSGSQDRAGWVPAGQVAGYRTAK